MSIRERFFGDKSFYARAAAIAVPVIVQNGITNLVNLLDNIMVGRLGTEEMSGVSIVNQFILIFNLLLSSAHFMNFLKSPEMEAGTVGIASP